MTKRYFEEFEVGDATTTIGRTVSESEVYRYAGLAGSYSELHTNQAAMEETPYGERLVQGPLTLTYLYGFTTMWEWDPEVRALYGIDGVRFVEPVFIDDTVHLEAEVTGTDPRDDAGVVTFDCQLCKEDGTVATVCDWSLLVGRE